MMVVVVDDVEKQQEKELTMVNDLLSGNQGSCNHG